MFDIVNFVLKLQKSLNLQGKYGLGDVLSLDGFNNSDIFRFSKVGIHQECVYPRSVDLWLQLHNLYKGGLG